jgi:probable HAF family extracellular repeat protein
MTDLGNLGKTSNAHNINSSGQIVGASVINNAGELRPFLWENGGPMVDLNTLVPPHPGVHLDGGDSWLNDRGEILITGTLSNGDNHAFLLIPDGDCDSDCEGRIAVNQNNAAPAQNAAMIKQGSESPIAVNQLRNRLMQRHYIPGRPVAPSD